MPGSELSQLESSFDCFYCFGVAPNLARLVLAGDDDLLVLQSNHSSFGFTWTVVVVSPEFQVIVEVLSSLWVNVFQEDDILALIAIKPLVAQLLVAARVLLPCGAALACT